MGRETGRNKQTETEEDTETDLEQRTFIANLTEKRQSIPVSCCTHIKNNQTIKRSLVGYLNVCTVSPLKERNRFSSQMKSLKKSKYSYANCQYSPNCGQAVGLQNNLFNKILKGNCHSRNAINWRSFSYDVLSKNNR